MWIFLMTDNGTLPNSPYKPNELVDLLMQRILRKNFVWMNSISFPSLKPQTSAE